MTKSGPFGPNPPRKTPILAHFVAKSGPFGRFGVVRRTPTLPLPLATGLPIPTMASRNRNLRGHVALLCHVVIHDHSISTEDKSH